MSIEIISGKRALGIAHTKDYTKWAEKLLLNGTDSENIEILAGMGLDKEPYKEEIEFYFQKCLKDLNIKLLSEEDALSQYAVHICNEIVNKNISTVDGVRILEKFYSKSD